MAQGPGNYYLITHEHLVYWLFIAGAPLQITLYALEVFKVKSNFLSSEL